MRAWLDSLKGLLLRRRRAPRYVLEVPMVVIAGGEHICGWCHDVSAGGISVTLSRPLSQATEASLELQLPSSPEALQFSAQVRYAVREQKGYRHGFKFVSLGPEERAALTKFLAAKSVGARWIRQHAH